jgi:hypothetical protein
MSNDRIHETYRGYVLIVALRNGKWRGRILKNRDIVDDVEGDSQASVHQSLKEIVDQTIEEKIGRRGEASPSAQEYIEAFKSIMNDTHDGQFAMLKAHYHAPDRAMTATQLAHAAGWSDYSSANVHYGKLGKLLNGELNMDLPRDREGKKIMTFVLADGERTDEAEGEWLWTMRPEVAEAVEYLGLNI